MSDQTLNALKARVSDLRNTILADGETILQALWTQKDKAPAHIRNLAHYLSLRQHDLRELQRDLMPYGLTSLGRLESRVIEGLDAALWALEGLTKAKPSTVKRPEPHAYFAGETALATHTTELFGPERPTRHTRIMVTLPSEAADDYDLVKSYARAGMDMARINCAHDDAEAWQKMAQNVRSAAQEVGHPITISMDIAGPKIRTARVHSHDKKARLSKGDCFVLTTDKKPKALGNALFAASTTVPQLVHSLKVGDSLSYNDGALRGIVVERLENAAVIKVKHAKSGGVKLKPEKGLNFPDTTLELTPLTTKDEHDLTAILRHADMVAYSFVNTVDDIDLINAALAKAGEGDRKIGLVLKIERPDAVANLPALIARAAASRPVGVMIARGDLAAEIGFERVAEMQEQILWICEAACIPVIWATQVLESLVKDGLPSRGEMTDAAMATRAEAIMLNKGAELAAGIKVLDHLCARMAGHFTKKTPTLRALRAFEIL